MTHQLLAALLCVALLAPELQAQGFTRPIGSSIEQPARGAIGAKNVPPPEEQAQGFRRPIGSSIEQPARGAIGAKNVPPPSKKPPTTPTPSTNQVSFAVHGSQIDSGNWHCLGLRVRAGEWVLVESDVLEALMNPNLPDGYLLAGVTEGAKSSCQLRYKSGETQEGAKQQIAFQATSDGLVGYATQNKVHLKVVMTVTNECPPDFQVWGAGAGR
jgi:hypothetical protein